MAYKNLKDYIKALDEHNELLTIIEFVDPLLEIAEITDRISKKGDGGKALLFKNNGSLFPVLINSYGSDKRMALALSANSLNEVRQDIQKLLSKIDKPKKGFIKKMKMLPELIKLSSYFPKTIRGKAACQQIVHKDPDLSILPILQCWPGDGGRFITLPMVITNSLSNGNRNVGMYRMQVIDKQTTAMHWHPHKTGAKHFEEYRNKGIKMPVAVAIGGDPILAYSATAPLPENIDEYIFSGFIRKKKVQMVKCLTQNIHVPAEADFIIEGYIDPNEEFFIEGPFGDHTGFYSLPDKFPKFHITCITHRKDAVYPATIVGIPPQEDAWIAKATELIFIEPLKYSLLPELEDLHLPMEGVAHNLALVSIDKSFEGHANKVMNALWGMGQMMFNKVMVIVDKDIEIRDYKNVACYIMARFDPNTSIQYSHGPLDILDHASSRMGYGSKLGIDATGNTEGQDKKKMDVKELSNVLMESINKISDVDDINCTLIDKNIPILIVGINKEISKDISLILKEFEEGKILSMWKLIIFVENTINIHNLSQVAWYVLNNIDPERDTFVFQSGSNSHFIVDGRNKANLNTKHNRKWPNVIVSDYKTIESIDKKWNKLNIGEFIPSPSQEYMALNSREGIYF